MTLDRAKRIIDEWLIVSKSLEGKDDTWKTYVDDIVLDAARYILDSYPLDYVKLDKQS